MLNVDAGGLGGQGGLGAGPSPLWGCGWAGPPREEVEGGRFPHCPLPLTQTQETFGLVTWAYESVTGGWGTRCLGAGVGSPHLLTMDRLGHLTPACWGPRSRAQSSSTSCTWTVGFETKS